MLGLNLTKYIVNRAGYSLNVAKMHENGAVCVLYDGIGNIGGLVGLPLFKKILLY